MSPFWRYSNLWLKFSLGLWGKVNPSFCYSAMEVCSCCCEDFTEDVLRLAVAVVMTSLKMTMRRGHNLGLRSLGQGGQFRTISESSLNRPQEGQCHFQAGTRFRVDLEMDSPCPVFVSPRSLSPSRIFTFYIYI